MPIGPLALEEGAPVYERGRERIGVVDHVMVDVRTGIFEGLVAHTRPLSARHAYAHHDQIAEVRERGVLLSVGRNQLHELDERRSPRAPSERLEPPLEAILRRAWDWINGVR